jgi:hypothetical protein
VSSSDPPPIATSEKFFGPKNASLNPFLKKGLWPPYKEFFVVGTAVVISFSNEMKLPK